MVEGDVEAFVVGEVVVFDGDCLGERRWFNLWFLGVDLLFASCQLSW